MDYHTCPSGINGAWSILISIAVGVKIHFFIGKKGSQIVWPYYHDKDVYNG